MESEIPKFFKVHWMNTSLKFIKNDNEMVLEYPEMAMEQVDFINHSIWQRKYDESGLEAIFIAICEALNTYTLKYQFKVIVTKIGNVGKLKVQKILKTEESSTSTDGQTEVPEAPTAKESYKIKIQNKHKISKTQKYYVVIRKIIDSVTPTFLKTNFQKILDFIKDESSGSIIFGDLTPSEASFLENFLGVFNRRETFSGLFSESCNDILEKFAIAYKQFERNAKLEICVVKTNERTRKREITFLKAPKYTINTTLKAKLIRNENPDKENTYPGDELQPVTKLLQALHVSDTVSNEKLHSSIENSSSSKNNIDREATIDKTNCMSNENVKNVKDDIKDNHTGKKENLEAVKSITVTVNNTKEVLENEKKNIINKVVLVNTQIDNKQDPTSNSIIEKNTDHKTIIDSRASEENKSQVQSAIDKKDLSNNIPQCTPQLSQSALPAKQTENTKIKEIEANINVGKPASTRKAKLLEAMSKPIECDKGLRMMRLMGWDGGALGQRGEGITVPIIPEINRTAGAGLGHVPAVKLPKKKVRQIRSVFFDHIMILLDENLPSIKIYFEAELTVKDERFYESTIRLFNKRKPSLGNLKNVYKDAKELTHKLREKEFLFFEIQFSACKRIVTVINLEHTVPSTAKPIMENINVVNKTKEKSTYRGLIHTEFKLIMTTKMLELLKNPKESKCLLSFDDVLKPKNLRFVDTVLDRINNNRVLKLTKKYEPIVKDINVYLNNYFLSVEFNEDLRSFTIHKLKENPKESITTTKENKLNNETQVLKKVNNAIDIKNKLDTTIDKNNNGDKPKTNQKENATKQTKSYILLIEPEDKMDSKEFVQTITNIITSKIDKEDEFLPYLKSHGIQNGFLVYSCQDKKSCLWLRFVLCQYHIIDYRGIDNKYVLQMKTNVQMDFKKVLSLLDKYNKSLGCLSWEILDRSKGLVKMDLKDFEFIFDKNFTLNAGIDEVEFNINYVQ